MASLRYTRTKKTGATLEFELVISDELLKRFCWLAQLSLCSNLPLIDFATSAAGFS